MNKAEKVFQEVYGDSKNLLTSDIVEYGETPKYYYELSETTDPFLGNWLAGVSLIDKKTKRKYHEGANCFIGWIDEFTEENLKEARKEAMEQARRYIDKLKKGIKPKRALMEVKNESEGVN